MNEIITNSNNQIIISGVNKDLFERWIAYIDASPKTIQTYSRAIKQFYEFLQDNGISNPTRDDIITYKNQIACCHKAATVNLYLMAIKQFFKWTAEEQIYPNIAEHIKGEKVTAGFKKDNLTSRQANKVITSIDTTTLQGKRDFAIITLMITTGLRTIEVARANIEDLRTVGDFTALFIQGKGRNDKAEYVKIPAKVEDAIRAYLTERGAESAEAPLFASVAHRNAGERMTTRSISRLVKEALIDADLNSSRLTAHSLRHTAATLNLLNGGTPEETMQLLRHKNLNTTLIYSHALERAKNESENRIANSIF